MASKVEEARKIVKDSEEAEAKVWKEYWVAHNTLGRFEQGQNPCPKCGSKMRHGSYQEGWEPREKPEDSVFLSIWVLYRYDDLAAHEPRWSWRVESITWTCRACGYSFLTHPKDWGRANGG